ncbi:MAG TPA: hypothetical protein IAC45_07195 [Candidatus Aphodousia faecavium]|uniref:AMP nucleosidase n=1 Tax=Parasutterella secunda TaxID=626947 RepID=A0ABS2GTB3_9BURK|nr:hypothetical protein [Parasutterella secunda]MBM6928411.1 hypothetical protein [Parasutterella secunda]HIT96824.1 hypothetical protein [Candidatus Aphodousia faecavium]
MREYTEIETITQLLGLVTEPGHIDHHVFQNIDFTDLADLAAQSTYSDCLFLGCVLPESFSKTLDKSNLIFPKLDAPFDIYRSYLYSSNSLYSGFDIRDESSIENTYDRRVYRHYLQTGVFSKNIKETLSRYLHDHSMSNAIKDFLSNYHERQIVGIMGGHDLLRTDPFYRQIVLLSKRLTEMGFIMVSGGGAGAMEATHLGAWLAKRSLKEVDEALEILSEAPSWQDAGWLKTAFIVKLKMRQTHFISLGVPTWLYGHEPATPFATHIAKFFDNSIREDTILNITRGGLIYTPGSAGTVQEIFQAAVPNHYKTYGYSSLMVFLGVDFWRKEMPVYPLIEHLVETGKYNGLRISITDNIEEVVQTVKTFRPQKGQ